MERTNFERFADQEEEQICGYDYEGFEIFEGDEYFETEHGDVLMSDMERYIREYFETKVAGS